jgi:hypothetical protein
VGVKYAEGDLFADREEDRNGFLNLVMKKRTGPAPIFCPLDISVTFPLGRNMEDGQVQIV